MTQASDCIVVSNRGPLSFRFDAQGELQPVPGGGRVTELMARPVLRTLFPDLAGIIQPLAGETAAPRSVLEKVGFADGYGVEIALLIDVATEFGADTLAQVDLGVRRHRNRPLAELGPQATEVLHAALERAGMGRA